MFPKIFIKILFCMILCLSCTKPAHPMGRSEKDTNPSQAYNIGRIEDAIRMLSDAEPGPEEKSQLVALNWEMRENARAAELLEELLLDQQISAGERNELRLELFITYTLMGDYSKAAALRSVLEPAVQRMDSNTRAKFFYYNGYVFHEMGNTRRAAELYRQSLDIYRWRPVAWYRLGLILRESTPREAETAFQNCWNQDRAFTAALLPLAQLLAARGQWVQARDYLITANARLPNDRAISTALAEARRRAPGSPGDGSSLIRRVISANPPRVTPAPPSPGEGTLRVGLIENRSLFSVKAGGDFIIYNAANRQVLYRGAAREQFWIEWDRGNRSGPLVMKGRDNAILLRSNTPILYELTSNQDTSIVAGVVSGAPATNRTYRGAIEFRPNPDGITVVNVLPMGDYLYGVIPAEMPASWPAEALKAQTIAARSYAIAYRGNFSARGFDIHGTPHSQAYHGVSVEHRNTTAAVDDTRGIILVGGNNQPLRAYYSANHGGYSEDSLTMWGYDAYMQAVPDRMLPLRTAPLAPKELHRWIRDTPTTYSNVPRYSFISSYRWEKWVSPTELRRRLPEDPGEIQRIITRGRGISGRVVEVEVQGSRRSVNVKGDAIWFALGGLRSSLFTIHYKTAPNGTLEYIIFQGAGHGHGMGMDQHGAAGMASNGINFSEILSHYYPRSTQRRL